MTKSTKLLERSINTANNNAKRKREPPSEDEIVTLLNTSVPLSICEDDDDDDDAEGEFDFQEHYQEAQHEAENERVALREMLADTMVVSMMAEEFRVFVGDMETVSGASVRNPPATVTTGTGKTVTAGASLIADVVDAGDQDEGNDNDVTEMLEALPKSARHRKPVFYHFTRSATGISGISRLLKKPLEK